MKMFVANVTGQNYLFIYRLPEINQLRHIPISAFSQVKLPDDVSKEQIDAVVAQHSPYGMVSSDEVNSKSLRKRSLCYSVDKPVLGVKMETLVRANHDVAVKDGEEIRRQTAIASSVALEKVIEEQTRNTELRSLAEQPKNFLVDVIEEESRDNNDSNRLSESYHVVRDAQPTKTTRRGK